MWLECWGIPLHGISKGILNCIGDVLGKVISVEGGIYGDLRCARIQIDTLVLSPTSGWINLYIDGFLFFLFYIFVSGWGGGWVHLPLPASGRIEPGCGSLEVGRLTS